MNRQGQPTLGHARAAEAKAAAHARSAARTRAIISEPIGRTLARLTVPMIAGIISLMLASLIDAYFLGQLGTPELAALGFILPVVYSVHSVGLGLGMGVSVLTARLLGEGRFDLAASLVTDSRLLVLAAGILVAIPLYLWRIELFTLMGAGPKVLPHVLEYMSQWLPAIPLIMLNLASNNTLRAAGSPAKSALVLTVVAAVNGLLDPLLIFGLGPIPGMGMAGAALAAVTAWIVSCAVSDHLLSVHEHLILRGRPQWRSLLVNWQQLLPIGVPAIFANLLTPIATAVLTAMVANFGATAVAGFGVCTRIDALSMIVVFALSATLPLFIGQNIGAGKIERARHALFTALKFSLLFQITVYLPLAILAPRIGALFSDNPQVIDTIAIYLRVVPLSYGAHAIVILVMVSLNALKRPRTALLTTVLRLLAINLPLAWLGGRLWGAAGLFTGFAGGNLIAGVLAYRIIQRVWREEFPPAAAA